MKLDLKLSEKVKELGFCIDNCNNTKDLCEFLPENYIFIEQRLWVGSLFIDADNFDYPNAVLKMIILLNK